MWRGHRTLRRGEVKLEGGGEPGSLSPLGSPWVCLSLAWAGVPGLVVPLPQMGTARKQGGRFSLILIVQQRTLKGRQGGGAEERDEVKGERDRESKRSEMPGSQGQSKGFDLQGPPQPVSLGTWWGGSEVGGAWALLRGGHSSQCLAEAPRMFKGGEDFLLCGEVACGKSLGGLPCERLVLGS